MYKDKERQREADKERQRRYRKGVTKTKGVTALEVGLTYPDIIDKLTDKIWRPRLEKICQSFKSRNPHDMQVCWLGDTNLSTVCDWLECTN